MTEPPNATLLAIDLGLRTGLALYGHDCRLRWYRSHNFGNLARLKRGIYSILNDIPNLHYLIMEGGDPYAERWRREANRRAIPVRQISAEEWRPTLLHERQQRTARDAKQHAARLAHQVITWSSLPQPTSLRHDAAEAILVGAWGLRAVGWLSQGNDSFPIKFSSHSG